MQECRDQRVTGADSMASRVGDASCSTSEWDTRGVFGEKAEICSERQQNGNIDQRSEYASPSLSSRMADSTSERRDGCEDTAGQTGWGGTENSSSGPATSPTNGFWRDVDWLLCRDGKFRPVGPGTFPLVNGAPSRVGRLRAYGNAINAEAAKTFIEACL